ncbi:hypothetical protein [Williamsoniiplasma lucivorax]|uniref:Uncharacterized protein n=1 Tax=Williamsoniiplasma lucivorax TaxID=209274 RepID=A0A2S5REN1_9MOLU|nr:hypothetical protein [Williamsoniiplasma lucivorax]PPE05757.1 hypothetical protein ELUCI_v1c00440 [Williamsoniiplasma lucivorax]
MFLHFFVEGTNNGSSITNLPWWAILIIIAVILIILVVIPWGKIRSKLDQNKDQKITLEQAKTKAQNYNASFLGIYNWFGKKQAMRLQRTVYVEELEDACVLCRPFENKVLSLEDEDQIMTMKQAIAQGYHHLGCHHIDQDYYIEVTQIPTQQWSDEHKQLRRSLLLKQYKLEDELRHLKYQLDNHKFKTKQKEDTLLLQITSKERALIKFIKDNDLTRNQLRERYNISDIQKFS